MSNQGTRNVAFYYGVSQRATYNELGDINSPEKPRAPIGAGCQTKPRRVFDRMRCFSAPAQEDCPFSSGVSVQRPASLDVGHSSSTTSTMNTSDDTTKSERDLDEQHAECHCPAVSCGVLPPGRTPMAANSALMGALYGVSWGSSPQPGYKRVSVYGHVCTFTIVEPNPRTPGTPPFNPSISGGRATVSSKSVSSPGAGQGGTPQDKMCPGCPSPNLKVACGGSE